MQHFGDDHTITDGLPGALSSTFPQKLFAMSQQEFDEGEIINWLPHGLAFKVVDSDKFSEEVIPKYFKHTKLTSFQRQLNLYGFRRITKGDDHGAYFHPSFQRNRRDLISSIKRLPSKVSRYATDSYTNDNETANRYAGLSLTECDVMDNFEMPPKKRPSTHQSYEDTFNDQTSSMPLFFNLSDFKSDSLPSADPISSNNARNHKRSANVMNEKTAPGPSQLCPHSGYPTSMPLPTMSKLTMNIGYAKHLATSTPAQDSSHNLGQASLQPSQYSSYNLLSNKRLHGPAGPKDSLSLANGQRNDPFSYQRAPFEVNVSQQLLSPPMIDYPLQSPQLTSMYANSANSSSINDFKLLMAQTSINDFTNWNDGSIWQPRNLAQNASSASSVCSEDDTYEQPHDFDEELDVVPSFDEAMDMMMSSR